MQKQLTADKPVKENTHIEYIEVLRVLSMLSVVFLHVAAGSLRGSHGLFIWHFSNVLTSIMSAAVPIFFMISGAVLMNSKKTLSIEDTFKKRLPKVALPFLAWSFGAVLYYLVINYIITGDLDTGSAVGRLKNMPSTATTVHLWFMYALIPLYIISPLLKKMVDSLTRELALYMMALWLFFSSLLPTAVAFLPDKYKPLLTLNGGYNLNFMTGYLGFFLAGYYLMRYEKRISKKVLTGMIILDTAIISFGTWLKTAELEKYSEFFKSYTRIFVLVLSVAIFLLVKELLRDKSLSDRLKRLFRTLSALSFGVYLIHNLLVDLISRKVPLWSSSSLTVMLLCYVAVLLMSILCMVILASIKPLCFIFTGLSFNSACETCNLQYFFRKRTGISASNNTRSLN